MSPPRIRLCLRPQRSFFGWFFFLVAAIVASGPTCSAEEGMITAVRHHQTLASTNDKKRRMCDRGALHKVLGVVAFVFNLFFASNTRERVYQTFVSQKKNQQQAQEEEATIVASSTARTTATTTKELSRRLDRHGRGSDCVVFGRTLEQEQHSHSDVQLSTLELVSCETTV